MPKNLIIVESPAKAKTIEKFLGKDYTVKSSFGHIRDLTKKDMGIDLDTFTPDYVISPDKQKVVKELREAAQKADTVWLASDEDREGEAIAWHLEEVLKLKPENTRRIVFHEITKNAILKAIENPRTVDRNLVNAQQARRVLDRIVGFEMSPVLWKKVKGGLSAGRVQSVALRLIVEREKEIRAFQPEKSYRTTAVFETHKNETIQAKLKNDFATEKEAVSFLESCKNADFRITDIDTKPSKRNPSAPFTTSTLQQDASSRLGYGVTTTMRIAQRLYEEGYITYMRTDSVNLSEEALEAAKKHIHAVYGKEYHKMQRYTSKNASAQEAHEAIRPTDFNLKSVPDAQLNKLYQLIYKRAVASQMAPAKLEKTKIQIQSVKVSEPFEAEGEVLLFDGFLKAYGIQSDDEKAEARMLPKVKIDEKLNAMEIRTREKYSRPAARYTEAGLVRKLEELGIGRPSTYAPTIQTIINREYVSKDEVLPSVREVKEWVLNSNGTEEILTEEQYGGDKNKFIPTAIGEIVTDFLTENFAEILDYGFTAKVESEFDEIAAGSERWKEMMRDFYDAFHPQIVKVEAHAERATGERLLGVDPKSGKNVYTRVGKYGPMVQIGESDADEKPVYASLLKGQNIATLTLEEALKTFQLPFDLQPYENIPLSVGEGRYGPYVKWGDAYISLPRGEDPFSVSQERAEELVEDRKKADAPVALYKGEPVTKGKGGFGPYLKYGELYVNVPKKYDFDNLSQTEIETLIAAKIEKEANRYIQRWEDKGIAIENGRWGPFIRSGKKMLKLPKNPDGEKYTAEELKDVPLDTVLEWIEAADPSAAKKNKKTTAVRKKTTSKKTTTRKTAAKKK